MRNKHTALAGALVATFGLTTGALAQSARPDPAQSAPAAQRPIDPASPGTAGRVPSDQGQQPTAQQVNPSPMPPGSRANQAPGMGATTGSGAAMQSQGAGALPGSTSPADPNAPRPGVTAEGTTRGGAAAPGMTPGVAPSTTAQSDPPGSAPARPADPMSPGTTGSMPSPTAQGGNAARDPASTGPATPPTSAQGMTPGMARDPAATGTTTPGTGATQGGGADTAPPAATTQHTEPRTTAAPVAGANSFTEGQARSRMADAGFNDVQELRLDEQGIWRARGIRNGQTTSVALDYQGNVVATQ